MQIAAPEVELITSEGRLKLQPANTKLDINAERMAELCHPVARV
jgi:hypothetical protein